MKKILVFWMLLLIVISFSGCGSSSGGGTNSPTTIGSTGTGDGQLRNPMGVALDSIGNIYVSDYNNKRIQKFSSSGTFLAKWAFNTIDDSGPVGLEVGNNKLYVCDHNQSRVQIFSLDGTLETTWAVPWNTQTEVMAVPVDVAVDDSGYVYVVDNYNHRVVKYNSAGTVISNFGLTSSKSGASLMFPLSIAIYGNNVFVTSSEDHRVCQYDLNGNFIREWGSEGGTNGKFFMPEGIAIMGNNSVIVGDVNIYPVFPRIQKFTFTGEYLNTIQPNGGTFQPKSMVVNNNLGKLYVCENGSNSIMVLDVF